MQPGSFGSRLVKRAVCAPINDGPPPPPHHRYERLGGSNISVGTPIATNMSAFSRHVSLGSLLAPSVCAKLRALSIFTLFEILFCVQSILTSPVLYSPPQAESPSPPTLSTITSLPPPAGAYLLSTGEMLAFDRYYPLFGSISYSFNYRFVMHGSKSRGSPSHSFANGLKPAETAGTALHAWVPLTTPFLTLIHSNHESPNQSMPICSACCSTHTSRDEISELMAWHRFQTPFLRHGPA